MFWRKKIHDSDIFDIIYLVLICMMFALYCIFYDAINLRIYSIVLGVAILIKAIFDGRVKLNIATAFLAQAMILVGYLGGFLYFWDEGYTMISVVFSYIAGIVLIADENMEITEKRAFAVGIAMTFGMFVHGVLGFIVTRNNGFLFSRMALTPWSKTVVAAPILAIDVIMIICAVVWAIANIKKQPILAMLVIVLAIISQWGIFYIMGSWFALSYFQENSFRSESTRLAIKLLLVQPLGNFKIINSTENSSYNMWLDYARDYGIITFVLLIIYKILTIVDAVFLVIKRRCIYNTKVLLVAAFIGLNLFYSFEKYARYDAHLWTFGLIIAGMIAAMRDDKKNS